MSIADELANFNTFLSNAYTKLAEKGATIPEFKNLQNLEGAIDSIKVGNDGLVAIYVHTMGETKYYEGNSFNLDGYVVMAVYGDGSQTEVTTLCSYPTNELTSDDTEVIISYTEDNITKEVAQPITIMAQIINYVMLYDNGAENTDITGGWTGYITYGHSWSVKYKELTKELDCMTSPAVSGNMYSKVTANLIDFSEYSMFGFCFFPALSSYNMYSALYLTTYPTSIASGVLKNTLSVAHDKVTADKKNLVYGTLTDKSVSCYFALTNPCAASSYNGLPTYYNVFLTKEDNWQPINEIGGLDIASASEITELQATNLMANVECLEYLAMNCTGNFMIQLIKNSNFQTAFADSVNQSILLNNEHWAKFLAMVE